jgi:hypothetical protein
MSIHAQYRLKIAAGGMVLALSGAGFAIGGWTYGIGKISQMGPGFLPFALGMLLLALGLAEMSRAWLATQVAASGRIDWRATLAILGSLLAFGSTVGWLGFDPAVFLTAFVASRAERQTALRRSLWLAAVLTVIADLLFLRALAMPLQVFGS